MTVGQRCSLLLQFLNLPSGDCKSGFRQCVRFPNLPPGDCRPGYRLFIRFKTYTKGTVWVGCSLFTRFLILPPRTCLPGCSLFIRFPNLPQGYCWHEVQGMSLLCPSHFSFPSWWRAVLGWLITRQKPWEPLSLYLWQNTSPLVSLSISRPKLNRVNMKRDRLIKTLRQLYDRKCSRFRF